MISAFHVPPLDREQAPYDIDSLEIYRLYNL